MGGVFRSTRSTKVQTRARLSVHEVGDTEPVISVILPVYKNSDQLNILVNRLVVVLAGMKLTSEIILVDDGSPDDSWRVITNICSASTTCRGIRFTRNFGQHAAIKAGLQCGRGTYFVLMDADLENRPEDLPKLWNLIQSSDFEIVLGRWSDEGKRDRLSRLFHRLIAAGTYDHRTLENAATFRIFSRRVRNQLLLYPESNAVYGPLMHQLGYAMGLVEIDRDVQQAPSSRYTFRSRLRLAAPLLLQSSQAFARLGSLIGLLLFGGSALMLGFAWLRFIFAGGNTFSTTSLAAIGLGGLFGALLALLGLALASINQLLVQVRQRPAFHVRDTLNFEFPYEE